MQIVFFFLFLLFVGLIFWAEHRLVILLAYHLSERYLHCRLIVAVLIAGIALTNVYALPYPVTLLNQIINSPVLTALWDTILPHRSYQLLFMLLSVIGLNLIVLTVEIVVLAVTRLIFTRARKYINLDDYSILGKVIHFPWIPAGCFYEEFQGKYHLNSTGFALGLWAKGMKYAFSGLLAAELLVLSFSIIWGSDAWNSGLMTVVSACSLVPIVAFLVCEQVQFYLEGETENDATKFGSENTDETLVGDMNALFDYYCSLVSDSKVLLQKRRGNAPNLAPSGLPSNDVGNRQLEKCTQPKVLNMLVNQLRTCGVTQCSSYQNAMVQLLNGNSIHVRDCNTGEFLVYLTAYLNFNLSQGKTALVLCRDACSAREIRQAMQDQMERLNDICSLWSICDIEAVESDREINILVCSCEDFQNRHVADKRGDFTRDLFCAVIMDGFDIFSQDSVRLMRLFNELRRLPDMKQFILISQEDNNDLRTAAERFINRELLPFCNDFEHCETGILVWKGESTYKIQRCLGIGSDCSFYMGVAVPLALVGLYYDLDITFIVPDPAAGYHSFLEVMGKHSQEVMRYLERSIDLDKAVNMDVSKVTAPQEISMLILYDNSFNMFNSLWRWMKYGGENQTLIHVISPPYMLREFFADHFNALLYNSSEFDAIVPHDLGMKQTHLTALLVSLCNEGMTESALMDKSSEFGWDYSDSLDILYDCLLLVFRKEEIHNIFEYFSFEEERQIDLAKNDIRNQTRIRLTDENVCRRLTNELRLAHLVSKNDCCIELPVLQGNIGNYFQRDQLIAVEGYLYQITAIHRGTVYADQKFPLDLPQYYQISSFLFDDWQLEDTCSDNEFMDLNLGTAAVLRHVLGYWSSNQANDFWHKEGIQLNYLTEQEEIFRQAARRFAEGQERHRYHVLQIRLKRAILDDKALEAETLLAYVLNELFKTLFPRTYQNLFAVTAHAPDTLCVPAEGDFESRVRSVIPCAEKAVGNDAEDPGFITVYVVEYSCMEYGMVKMVYENRERVFSILSSYLSWYLSPETAPGEAPGAEADAAEAPAAQKIRGSYLHFGAPEIPSIFAPDVLLQVCGRLTPHYEVQPDSNHGSAPARMYTCDFCFKPLAFAYRLKDKRCMCSDCRDHQISQRDEVYRLFESTKKLLMRSYHLPSGALNENKLYIQFRSADAIREMAAVSTGRVLGFYNYVTHQLWIEGRGPRVSMQATLIHELTHAWQYKNLDLDALKKKLSPTKKERERKLHILLEGHAVYAEIETMRRMNELAYADHLHAYTMSRADEYGEGYRLVGDYLRDLEAQDSALNPILGMQALATAIVEGKVTVHL